MGGMVTVDINTFRQLFPEFSDATKYPDTVLELQLDAAQDFVSPRSGLSLKGNARARAIYLMCAVLIKSAALNSSGNTTAKAGITTSATIDKVSVGKSLPTFGSSAFKYLLLKYPPYGDQLLALLQIKAAAGIFANGSYENVLP